MTMSRQTLLWAAAAVLLFWAVGGYNRLVRSRNAIQQSYAALDARVIHRNDCVDRLARALQPAFFDPAVVETLAGALAQSQAAREQARRTPCDAAAITNLGVAERVLTDARRRLAERMATPPPDGAAPDPGLASLVEQIAQADAALSFAREEFNRAAADYNHAVRQFPTRVLAAIFGFSAGATLPAGA